MAGNNTEVHDVHVDLNQGPMAVATYWRVLQHAHDKVRAHGCIAFRQLAVHQALRAIPRMHMALRTHTTDAC